MDSDHSNAVNAPVAAAPAEGVAPKSNRWSLLPDNDNHEDKQVPVTESNGDNDGRISFKEGGAKYRCEQFTITRMNGVIQNHADTKREFHIKKYKLNDQYIVDVKLVDNVITTNQANLTDALNLLCEIDSIKCNAALKINEDTGKIVSIANMNEVLSRWSDYRQEFLHRYSFVKDENIKKSIENFVAVADSNFKNEKALITDFKTKPFFEVFFDEYLVHKDFSLLPYTLNYFSQLFEQVQLVVGMQQKIERQTPDTIQIQRTSALNRGSLDLKRMEEIYDLKFKPEIGYKFSTFDFKQNSTILINTADQLIDAAEVTIEESVKNNVELIVTYKLRRIE